MHINMHGCVLIIWVSVLRESVQTIFISIILFYRFSHAGKFAKSNPKGSCIICHWKYLFALSSALAKIIYFKLYFRVVGLQTRLVGRQQGLMRVKWLVNWNLGVTVYGAENIGKKWKTVLWRGWRTYFLLLVLIIQVLLNFLNSINCLMTWSKIFRILNVFLAKLPQIKIFHLRMFTPVFCVLFVSVL